MEIKENLSQKQTRGKHYVANINYHVVFCSKRRKPVLVQDIASDCKSIMHEQAEKSKLKIEALEVMPDHVHAFVSAPPKLSPFQIVKRLKGHSAKILREKYPQLLRLPALWGSSYYIGTVGHVSESVVKNYIENQKGK